MKYLHFFLAFIFLLFAIVQYNDPDALLWIPVYLVVSFLALLEGMNKPKKKWALFFFVVLAAWTMTYIPDFMSWLSKGSPNIAGSMQAESPHIELMRELFGLLLSASVCGYYAFKK